MTCCGVLKHDRCRHPAPALDSLAEWTRVACCCGKCRVHLPPRAQSLRSSALPHKVHECHMPQAGATVLSTVSFTTSHACAHPASSSERLTQPGHKRARCLQRGNVSARSPAWSQSGSATALPNTPSSQHRRQKRLFKRRTRAVVMQTSQVRMG